MGSLLSLLSQFISILSLLFLTKALDPLNLTVFILVIVEYYSEALEIRLFFYSKNSYILAIKDLVNYKRTLIISWKYNEYTSFLICNRRSIIKSIYNERI